jgi:hypothetical protein
MIDVLQFFFCFMLATIGIPGLVIVLFDRV